MKRFYIEILYPGARGSEPIREIYADDFEIKDSVYYFHNKKIVSVGVFGNIKKQVVAVYPVNYTIIYGIEEVKR